jgi:hypothetical protein
MLFIDNFEKDLTRAQELFAADSGVLNPKWRIWRIPTVIDQLYQNFKKLEYDFNPNRKGIDLSYDTIHNEFLHIINNAIIGHIQLTKGPSLKRDTSAMQATNMYDDTVELALLNFKQELLSDLLTIHYFYECIGQIMYRLKTENNQQEWDNKKDDESFLNLIVYGLCGAKLLS